MRRPDKNAERRPAMTIEEIKRKKRELGLTSLMISEASDIPLSTIQKIISGVTKSPRRDTLEAIESVLYAEEQRRRRDSGLSDRFKHTSCQEGDYGQPSAQVSSSAGRDSYAGIVSSPDGIVMEPVPIALLYPATGNKRVYTVEDYYAIPDDRRVELIDGVIYDMGAPAVIHQKILGELHLLFRECVDAHEGVCDVYLSPCDVRLDSDNYTMVQPDMLVICREYDLGAKAFDGPPDLTVEILSPSTRSKDMLLKLYKYQHAGVKEYWIIDPENETVLVYDFQEGSLYPEKYAFDSLIPIHLSGGECSIDFSRINRALKKRRG